MAGNQNFSEQELDRELVHAETEIEAEEPSGAASKENFKLLLLSLILSAISGVLAIFVAIRSRSDTIEADKSREQSTLKLKKEIRELHKEIDLLKNEVKQSNIL